MLRGQRSFSWKLLQTKEHPDFKIVSNIYTHDPLGSKVIHLKTTDSHKAFASLFRTTPNNSKGTPHCLEHIALCGSEKFPVRDPFFKMISRSLNSYMNAWTGPDFTMYPFSTQNDKDFSNLLSIYLDATFFPLITYPNFRQEAWRTEFEEGKLEYKGVVFNEMKATITDSNDFFIHLINKYLLEGTTYEHNSGGDPKEIPLLSYEELKDFHRRFYHPSNATFMFYGDMDIQKHLQELEENALNKFQKLEMDTSVGLAVKRNEPIYIYEKFPADEVSVDPDKQGKFSISYLCPEMNKDPYFNFCMSVLSSSLIDGQNTPLYKALLETQLGKSFLSGTGFDASSRESTFTIGLNGIKESDKEAIEKAIFQTLENCAENGIDRNLIDSSIHQIEIRVKQVKSNFGLMLISSMAPFLLHNGDPLTPLYINEYVNRLRQDLAEGKPVFQNLIRDHLLGNKNRVSILGVPDTKYAERLIEEENSRLKSIEEKLTEEEKKNLEEEAKLLLEDQEKPQNVDLLPTLKVSDIDPKIDLIDYTHQTTVSGIPVKFIEQPTNGISYIRLKIDISNLPERLKPFLPLYNRLVNQVGTKKHNHGDFDNLKDMYTVSGVSCSSIVACENDSIDSHTEQLSYKIAFLDRNIDKGFEIFSEFLNDIIFSEHDHISRLIQRSVKSRTDELNNEGMTYASSISSASLSTAGSAYEALNILQHDCLIANNLLNQDSSQQTLADIANKLSEIHQFLMQKKNMEVLVHTSELNSLKENFIQKIGEFSSGFELENQKFLHERSSNLVFQPSFIREYYTLPMQVNYVIEAVKGTSLLSADHGPLSILCELLSLNIFLREIREKGGAYGGGIKSNTNTGVITLYSYRDPNNLKTYQAFEKCINEVCKAEFDQRQIDEAKLSAFSKIDKPIPAFDKGLALFYHGLTNELRQGIRTKVLEVNKSDLLRVAEQYLLKPLQSKQSSRVVFGSDSIDRNLLAEEVFAVKRPINK